MVAVCWSQRIHGVCGGACVEVLVCCVEVLVCCVECYVIQH